MFGRKKAITLDQLSVEDLLARKTDIDREISSRVSALAALGYAPSISGHVAPEKKPRETKPSKAKYRDPGTGAEWSGKGHSPAWLKTLIDQGRSKEEFAVRTEAAE